MSLAPLYQVLETEVLLFRNLQCCCIGCGIFPHFLGFFILFCYSLFHFIFIFSFSVPTQIQVSHVRLIGLGGGLGFGLHCHSGSHPPPKANLHPWPSLHTSQWAFSQIPVINKVTFGRRLLVNLNEMKKNSWKVLLSILCEVSHRKWVSQGCPRAQNHLSPILQSTIEPDCIAQAMYGPVLKLVLELTDMNISHGALQDNPRPFIFVSCFH